MEGLFFALTDLHLTQKAPKPRARGDNPRRLLTIVPLFSPQKALGQAGYGTEAAVTPKYLDEP